MGSLKMSLTLFQFSKQLNLNAWALASKAAKSA